MQSLLDEKLKVSAPSLGTSCQQHFLNQALIFAKDRKMIYDQARCNYSYQKDEKTDGQSVLLAIPWLPNMSANLLFATLDL
jgi:hypothetical protein